MSAKQSVTHRRNVWLWVIVGTAFLIRAWGTWYGLPFSYWVDEYHEVLRALELGSGGFNLERTTKGGFYLVLFVEYGVSYVIMRVFGIVGSSREFAESFVRDPTLLYLIGRLTAAAAGAATVTVAYFLARVAYSHRAALVGAMLLALNVLHIDLSRRIGVDVPMALMATAALLYGVKVARDGHSADYALAGLFAALATSTKLPGILLMLPLLIAHGYGVSRSQRPITAWVASPKLWLAAGVFAVVLIATNPGAVLGTGYISFVNPPASDITTLEGLDVESELPDAERPNLFVYYLDVLKDSMGWPLFGLAGLAVIHAMRRRTPADVILLSYALANYLAIAGTSSEKLFFPRYAVPIIVVLVILSGRAFSELTARIGTNRAAIQATLIGSLLAWPVWQAGGTAYALTQTDTRTVARDWIQQHVPAGEHILIEGLKIGPVKGTVQLTEAHSSLERRRQYWRKHEPKQAKFLDLQLAVHAGGGYILELIRVQSIEPLESYVNDGVKYFVIRPEYFLASNRSDAASARFYEDLRNDTHFMLLKRFEGDAGSPPGPTIEVYGPASK